jgi:LmbE family N-acetylglucosaminyl deacetylase
MRVTRQKLAGLARWLGVLGGATRLRGDVVVVSPHLDDAALSLGAALAHAARNGVPVTVLTVLAGDVDSRAPAGKWDADAGFATAGEAARARRAVDARACAILGATPVWLPYSDHQYERGASDGDIRGAVVEAVGGAGAVLLPGFPLVHEDHRWLSDLLADAFEPERVGLYTEQPYAALWTDSPGRSTEACAVADDRRWRCLRAGVGDRRRKLRACRAYTTQLPLLGNVLGRMSRFEMRVGGETAALPR